MSNVHVTPIDDLIQHEKTEECVCGPTIEPVETPSGAINWMLTHNALDNREAYEKQGQPSPGWLVERF